MPPFFPDVNDIDWANVIKLLEVAHRAALTAMTAPVVVMANVLGGPDGGMSIDERLHHLFAAEPAAKVHLYGKQVRPGRKIGHVTVLGDELEDVRARAARAARWLREGHGD